MAYLPPEEITQVKSLLAVIADPKAFKERLDEISQKDAVLDQKLKDIQAISEDTKNRMEVEIKAAQEAQDTAETLVAQAEAAKDKYIKANEKLEYRESKIAEREHFTSQEEKRLEKLSRELLDRESILKSRESSLNARERELSVKEGELTSVKEQYENKLAKLKAVVE